jgi:hypothetical protein
MFVTIQLGLLPGRYKATCSFLAGESLVFSSDKRRGTLMDKRYSFKKVHMK